MEYSLFTNTIIMELQRRLGEEYRLTLRKVHKNNGIILDALCIVSKNEHVCPAIYINSYYADFINGKVSINDIVTSIINSYHSNEKPPILEYEDLSDFTHIKERITFKLINADSNKELLNHVPYIQYLDLAIVFYILLHENESEIMTAQIKNDHLDIWKVSSDELKEIAFANTPKLLPPVILGVDEIIPNSYKKKKRNFRPYQLYILTNSFDIDGAACMLYPDVIQKFVKEIDRDLYIIPSSINEVLLFPDDGFMTADELSSIVIHVNMMEIPINSRLSNQVYFYSKFNQTLSIASTNRNPI